MKRFKPLYLAALLLPGLALAADWPAYPFVHANATASIFVVPDTVSISLDVVSVQADADLATQEVEAGIARIRALVDTLGDKDATTVIQDLRKEPRPNKGATAPADDPAQAPAPLVEAKATVTITLRDMEAWRPLVTGLMAMRELDTPMSTFSNTEQVRIENDLMAQALRKARVKADSMAAGVGRKIDSVGAVSAGSLANLSTAMGFGPPDQRRADIPGRVTGPLRVHMNAPALRFSQSVDVVYKLK